MIYFVATFLGITVLIGGLLIKIFGNKSQAFSSCNTITSLEKNKEVYCESCAEIVKDRCPVK